MYYCDVDATLTMSSTSLDQALTAASDRGIRIGTVIVTHLYGRVADVPAIRDVCEHHRRRHGPDGRGPAILEDCSHSFPGAGQRDGPGRWGDAAAWSFYPTKPLGALGDGGAVTTASNDVAQAVKQLAQYGWGRRFDVIRAGGRNSRLDELQAAVLHHRLRVDVAVDGADANETDRDLASQARRRREIANAYRDALPNEVRDLVPPMVDSHACHLAVCRTRDRAGLSSFLADRGIATDIHYPVPDHHQSGISGEAIVPVPNSERACAEVLTLPCFSELTDDEVSRVCLALSNWPPSVAHRRL
jgi:dTDP-4-amino-4,6-dideoxygalactose transaminase